MLSIDGEVWAVVVAHFLVVARSVPKRPLGPHTHDRDGPARATCSVGTAWTGDLSSQSRRAA